MVRRHPRSKRTESLIPYTTLCRSHLHWKGRGGRHLYGQVDRVLLRPFRRGYRRDALWQLGPAILQPCLCGLWPAGNRPRRYACRSGEGASFPDRLGGEQPARRNEVRTTPGGNSHLRPNETDVVQEKDGARLFNTLCAPTYKKK